jgi:hypothetical protein
MFLHWVWMITFYAGIYNAVIIVIFVFVNCNWPRF